MMRDVFTADSALVRVLGRLADVVVLNLIFVATSLPIVTLGASLTALNATAMRIAREECDHSVVSDYLRAFRANLRQGSLLLLVLAGLGAVLAGWYTVVVTMVSGSLAQLGLLAVWLVLVIQLTTTALFAFPYLARFDDSTRTVLRNARLMSWRHPLVTLAVVLLVALPTVLTVFYPHLTGYGLIWLWIGFGGVAYVCGRLFAHVFARYTQAVPTPHDTTEGAARALA